MPGKRLERQVKGKVIKATTINQIVDGAQWMSRFNVAPGFGMISTAAGPVIYDARPRKIPVKLTSNSSPYSFSQVYPDSSGGWTVLSGGITGTNSAYEANGAGGLQDAIVFLEQSSVNDWRFYVARGVADSTCAGTTRICVTVNSGCSTIAAHGATITVKDHTGVTIASCTASGFILSLSLIGGGSGYTNGTGYALSFSGGSGTGASGTFDVVAGHVTNLVLTSGGSGYITPPTIGFPGAGGGSGASATANISAKCCVDIPSSGTYTIETGVPGATTLIDSFHAVCNTTNNFTASFPSNSLGILCAQINHCEYALGGDAVVITKPGKPTGNITTGSDGKGCVVMAAGTGYSALMTAPQGASKTVTTSVTACSTTTIGMNTTNRRCYRGVSNGSCSFTITLEYPVGTVLGSTTISPTFDGIFFVGSGCVTFPEMVEPGSVTIKETFTCPAGTYISGGATTSLCAPSGTPVAFDFRTITGTPCC